MVHLKGGLYGNSPGWILIKINQLMNKMLPNSLFRGKGNIPASQSIKYFWLLVYESGFGLVSGFHAVANLQNLRCFQKMAYLCSNRRKP
jgi:hypothetical protein